MVVGNTGSSEVLKTDIFWAVIWCCHRTRYRLIFIRPVLEVGFFSLLYAGMKEGSAKDRLGGPLRQSDIRLDGQRGVLLHWGGIIISCVIGQVDILKGGWETGDLWVGTRLIIIVQLPGSFA
jgi:hypothetical protein